MTRRRLPSSQARRLLAVLRTRPADWRHGYELAKLAELSSGTLYPLLIRLHGKGLLEARWEPPITPGRPPRHVYRLTAQGLSLARAEAEETRTTRAGHEALAS